MAVEAGVEMLEQEARRRALSGVKDVEAHYDKDGKVNYRKVTKYSDTLLIFLLRAGRPNKYRDVLRLEQIDVSKLSGEELEAIARGESLSQARIAKRSSVLLTRRVA